MRSSEFPEGSQKVSREFPGDLQKIHRRSFKSPLKVSTKSSEGLQMTLRSSPEVP